MAKPVFVKLVSTHDSENENEEDTLQVSSEVQDLDSIRRERMAYEYLCHLEETRSWIQSCISEELPPTTELEESLRNGVYLAKLAHFINPTLVPARIIYDSDQTIYHSKGLQFRHTENINYWIQAMSSVNFPSRFYPDAFDVYDKRNSPKTIYCLHGLSMYLFKQGLAPRMQDLYGKVEFSREDINTMGKELQKYGLQLPAFHKIDGILMDSVKGEDAALHAAVIAINTAIEEQYADRTLHALRNPNARITNNLLEEFSLAYQEVLFAAKKEKSELACNQRKATADSDAYDTFLTHQEIQKIIDDVNLSPYIEDILLAVMDHSIDKLIDALTKPNLQLHNVVPKNSHLYLQYIRYVLETDLPKTNNNQAFLTKDIVQRCIMEVNETAPLPPYIISAVNYVNQALNSGTPADTVKALRNPVLCLPEVCEFAAMLYHEEFSNFRNETGSDLSIEELTEGVKLLSAVALINRAVISGDAEEVYARLSSPAALIFGVDALNKGTYLRGLSRELECKKHSSKSEPHPLLNHTEIQEIVDSVNRVMDNRRLKQSAKMKISQAICSKNLTSLIDSLLNPDASILSVVQEYARLYLFLFENEKLDLNKADQTLDDVQRIINKGNSLAFSAFEVCMILVAIHTAIKENDCSALLSALKSEKLGLKDIDSRLVGSYLKEMQKEQEMKLALSSQLADDSKENWVQFTFSEDLCFYFNAKTLEQLWENPSSFPHTQYCLSLSELGALIEKVNLAAKHRHKSSTYKSEWQSESINTAVITLQSHLRRWIAQKHYDKLRQKHYAAKVIQSWWRAHKMHTCFEVLKQSSSDPPFQAVRQLIFMFQSTDIDYAEELEVRKLKSQVVQMIRLNQELEKEVKEMDIKIGLLVRNRATLQELISQKHGFKGKNAPVRSSETWIRSGRGLKELNKESQKLLESYEQLFYVLQSEPVYLARLMFAMPPSRSNTFMETVIFSLYNYGSSDWEQYQLQRLFRAALEQEINEKITDIHGISTSNPLVIKMVVEFNRSCNPTALQQLLKPLVLQVIEDKSLKIMSNPSDVYRLWINEMEVKSGERSEHPYNVTEEEALLHEEVRRRLEASRQKLKRLVELFCDRIVNSLDQIPYGMLYMAKVLRNALANKFPQSSKKDLLKVVGNLLYYRYINPVITAPDAFDIIALNSMGSLTTEQRKNLAWIAKILQFAASGKGFSCENAIWMDPLNPFITECFHKFQHFFQEACNVPEPEEYYDVDRYTEATFFIPSSISLTAQELCDTHELLLQHRKEVAPNSSEPINRILDDLGNLPSLATLIGGDLDESSWKEMATSPIHLTLSGKLDVENSSPSSETDELFLVTKEMIVELFKVRKSSSFSSIKDMLVIPLTEEEEDCFQSLESSNLHRYKLSDRSLSSFVDRVHQNLSSLELADRVSKENDYNDILSSIVKDIQILSKHRQSRKKELKRLPNTQHQLKLKEIFFKEKLEYYQQYIKRCLDNLSARPEKSMPKSKSTAKEDSKKAKATVLKYTASKLQEKGVLVQVDGVESSQLKHITLKIQTTTETGIFLVSAKFFGMEIEKVFLNIQDLLQLQYEGTAIMRLFDKVTVNINLLLYILNSKFYK